MQSVIEYIKSQKWFFGARADESLLFYSAKQDGCNKHIKKEYGISFAETLLVPLKKNKPIRVFNEAQAKSFHLFSGVKISHNPRIISAYIKKNDVLYRNIEKYGKELRAVIQDKDYPKSIRLFCKISDLYKIASAQFIIIFSLGLALTKNKSASKNRESAISEHDTWRNSVVFKEEALGENLFFFFKFIIARKKLNLAPLLCMKFLTLRETLVWLQEKMTDIEVIRIIKSRKAHGYIYVNLKNKKQEVIDDSKDVTATRKYLLDVYKKENKQQGNGTMVGRVAYGSTEVIRGSVVVIKDKSELNAKGHLIDNRIVVAIQTTPHYIPYLKKARAIITDEGGITCHAAIVAREYKIPCVVGTNMATQILKDGDEIEIDMRMGVIRVVR